MGPESRSIAPGIPWFRGPSHHQHAEARASDEAHPTDRPRTAGGGRAPLPWLPQFFTAEGSKGKTFASVHDEREWGEGRLCLWAAGPKELQAALVDDRPEHYFIPPYVGHRGWVGLRLDLPEVNWDEVAGVIEDAHAHIVG